LDRCLNVWQEDSQRLEFRRVRLHVTHRLRESIAFERGQVVLASGVARHIALEGLDHALDDRSPSDPPIRFAVRCKHPFTKTVARPVPETRLAKRPVCVAAARIAADVPMSGPATWGFSRRNPSATRTMNSPIARGYINALLRSERPNPGRSIATRWACSASRD